MGTDVDVCVGVKVCVGVMVGTTDVDVCGGLEVCVGGIVDDDVGVTVCVGLNEEVVVDVITEVVGVETPLKVHAEAASRVNTAKPGSRNLNLVPNLFTFVSMQQFVGKGERQLSPFRQWYLLRCDDGEWSGIRPVR